MNYNELEELVMESKGILRQSRDKNLGLYQQQANPKYWIARGENDKEAREHSDQARDKIREIKNDIRQHINTDQKLKAQRKSKNLRIYKTWYKDERERSKRWMDMYTAKADEHWDYFQKANAKLWSQDGKIRGLESDIRILKRNLNDAGEYLQTMQDMEKKAAIAVGLTASFAAITAGAAKIISKVKQNKAIPYLKKLDKLKAESAKITAAYKSGKLNPSDYVEEQLRIKNEIESCINSINTICKNTVKVVKESVDSEIMDIYESVGYGYITEEEAEFLLSM